MIDISIREFLNLSETDRMVYTKDSAVLYAQQFDRAELDYLCQLADACRALNKKAAGQALMEGLLRHRMALNFFVQPSSRTFMSFSAAQAILGMRRMSVRDVKISSMSKGETLADSIRTFISYVDLIVMRHHDEDAGAVAAWVAMKAHRRIHLADGSQLPIPIISGGSGAKQHPTQSLLDIYTLSKSFETVGGIDGKTIMLVGDLKRGRTVRSLSYLMKNYRDVKLVFAAPPEYQMLPDICEFLDRHSIPWRTVDSISAAVGDVDAVYMTRIQDEHDNLAPGSGHVATKEAFRFTMDHLKAMRPHACLLHPLPKRDEIEPDLDYCGDKRVVYWRQERNGMWLRTGLIARMFRADDAIMHGYGEICGG